MSSWINVFKGTSGAIITILILALLSSCLFATLLHFTSMTETTASKWLNGSVFVFAVIGSMAGGAFSKSHGWVIGAITGLLLIALSIWTVWPIQFEWSHLFHYTGLLLLSCTGGVAGVNLFNKS
ncbi:TIGR04086 family membrane protein [Jeotgalibacillus aurantiacus]|uniref:TIGR04086 family membrane protein n=1 Tax=Jeotgalibacillus aurantiacus TaxID=2763266 RepID=UPI001D0AEB08|nr:TIGR04086 family membrane protein [Jeotgalibacillus aurantiacus]